MKNKLMLLGLFVAILSTKSVFPENKYSLCVSENHLTQAFCLAVNNHQEWSIQSTTNAHEIEQRLQAELVGEAQEILLYELASQNQLSLNELKAHLIK